MTKITRPDMVLWTSESHGIYIPQWFADSFIDRAKHVSGVSDDQWAILDAGPDHEVYWEVWDEVTSNAVVTDENGIQYDLYQDGDLWLIPKGMQWDIHDGFYWPEEETTN